MGVGLPLVIVAFMTVSVIVIAPPVVTVVGATETAFSVRSGPVTTTVVDEAMQLLFSLVSAIMWLPSAHAKIRYVP